MEVIGDVDVGDVLYEVTRWLLLQLRAIEDEIARLIEAEQWEQIEMWGPTVAETHRTIEAVEAVRLML